MTTLRPLVALLATVFALALPLAAQTFITPSQIDIATALPPPPAPDSLTAQADLDTVLHVQADRTPAQIARAQAVANQTLFTFAAPVLGPWFTAQNLPRTAAIFDTIYAQAKPITMEIKNHFQRTRPYDLDSRVQPVVARLHDTSYPSGHSTGAAEWGLILAAAFPDKKAALDAQVHEAMWSRVLGGAHFPTDTQAGKRLGELIAREILKSPDMQKALDEIRAEAAPFLLKKAA